MKSARYIIYFPIYIKRITKKLNIQRVGKQKYNCFNCSLEKWKKKKKIGQTSKFLHPIFKNCYWSNFIKLLVKFPILPWHAILEPHAAASVLSGMANYQFKKRISYSTKMFSHLRIDLIWPCLWVLTESDQKVMWLLAMKSTMHEGRLASL